MKYLIAAIAIVAMASTAHADVWKITRRPAKSVWAVTQSPTIGVTPKPTPKVMPVTKSCPCSTACECGCNQGKPCTCGNSTTTTSTRAPVQYQSGQVCVGGT